MSGEAGEGIQRHSSGDKDSQACLKGELKGTFYLTVTAADWPNVQLEWPDGTTMAVVPIKPVDGYAFCIGKQPITNRRHRDLIAAPEPAGEIREGGKWRPF